MVPFADSAIRPMYYRRSDFSDDIMFYTVGHNGAWRWKYIRPGAMLQLAVINF